MLKLGQRAAALAGPWHAALLLLLLSSLRRLGFCSALRVPSPHRANFKMFKARYPLEGGPPQVKLHVAIIVEDPRSIGNKGGRPNSEGGDTGRRLVLFDFLPNEPTAFETTLRLLTGNDVPGNLRERELRFLPPGAVYVGESDATIGEMRGFVAKYPDRLSLVSNNCFSFVDAFIARHRLE
ncbi:unnamed protein product [Ectocarpus sp. 4 AP-2014]